MKTEMLDNDGNHLFDIYGMKLQVARKNLRGLPAGYVWIIF